MRAFTVTSYFLNIFFLITLVTAPLFAQLPMREMMKVRTAVQTGAGSGFFDMALNYEAVADLRAEEAALHGGERFEALLKSSYKYYGLSSTAIEALQSEQADMQLASFFYLGSYSKPLLAEFVHLV